MTKLEQFFDYMVKNNYWIGNDLVEEYRRLREEEKAEETLCHYSGLRNVDSYEEDK